LRKSLRNNRLEGIPRRPPPNLPKRSHRRPKKPVEDFFIRLLKEDLYTNLLVLDETLYISKTRYRIPYDSSLTLIKKTIVPYSELIAIDESDIDAMGDYLQRYDLKPSDALHLATMKKVGITHIATEDKEFDRVKETKRIWLEPTTTKTGSPRTASSP
jgi:predicted nucleic acid-binding protein